MTIFVNFDSFGFYDQICHFNTFYHPFQSEWVWPHITLKKDFVDVYNGRDDLTLKKSSFVKLHSILLLCIDEVLIKYTLKGLQQPYQSTDAFLKTLKDVNTLHDSTPAFLDPTANFTPHLPSYFSNLTYHASIYIFI